MIEIFRRDAIDINAPISTNFKWWEWVCSCGKCDNQPLDSRLFPMLEALRSCCADRSVSINSGYRCPERNRQVGGAPKSRHMIGDAADISVKDHSPTRVAEIADQLEFTGIKIYSSWVHVDLREGEWKPNLPWRKSL